MTAAPPVARSQTGSYQTLRRQVEEALLTGQRRIEEAKVQTYWNTGKLIQDHLLQNKERAEYGERILLRLSEDLGVSIRLLQQSLQFYRAYPRIANGGAQSSLSILKWSHYRTLSRISDDRLRANLEAQAVIKGWTAEELDEQVKEFTPKAFSVPQPPAPVPLSPRRGEVYTYKMIRPEKVNAGKATLKIDLGFSCFREAVVAGTKDFEAGDIVTSEWVKKDVYRLRGEGEGGRGTEKPEQKLFTYNAEVERVVDGDTILCIVDLGFGFTTRQYLRLRGIDCPEIDTADGKRAKAFVEKQLQAVPSIVICSSKSDKYDRYLADVFIPGAGGKGDGGRVDMFLNQKLLDEGLATEM